MFTLTTSLLSADGAAPVARKQTWGGSKQRLVQMVGREYGLNQAQRGLLLARGTCRIDRKNASIELNITEQLAPLTNELLLEKPLWVKLADGTKVNWCGMNDEDRAELRRICPDITNKLDAIIAGKRKNVVEQV